jgi:hypothetical protein
MAEPRTGAAGSETGTFEEARELLNAELPDPRFVDDAYLDWLYRQNPYGPAITGFRRSGTAPEAGTANGAGTVDGAGAGDPDTGERSRLDGHYALIPQRYVTPDGPIPFMFSLNAVSRSGSQRRGTFVSLTKELFARAAEAGYVGAIGVTNDNSTRAVKRTAFRYLGPMPVIARIGSMAGRNSQ